MITSSSQSHATRRLFRGVVENVRRTKLLCQIGAILSPGNIVAFAIVLVLIFASYLAWRNRSRCPYRNPLCRTSKPCLLCYRDLYKTIVPERGTS